MQGKEDLSLKLAHVEASADERVASAEDAMEKAVAEAKAQEAEVLLLQKKLKESEQANARLSSDFASQKEKLDAKIQNQRQVSQKLRFPVQGYRTL